MKLITVSGPPSSGKTSVILRAIECLQPEGYKIGIVKFDCLSTHDNIQYEKIGVPVKVGLSGNLCPDHFFVCNIEDCVQWGKRNSFDLLISESAGLCNRCSPHIKGAFAVCVIDSLAGVNTPRKVGPMLKLSDLVVVTKGDIVSQAEREVFAFRIRQANPKAAITYVNGITGQGAYDLGVAFKTAPETGMLNGDRLRFSMPAALCSYCLGETRIGEEYQTGSTKKMVL